MNWKVKAHLQKFLAGTRIGDQVNHLHALTNKNYYSNGVTYHFHEFFRKFDLVKSFNKDNYAQANALEIGTGYFMIEPLVLSLLGFKNIVTVDVTRDVNFKTFKRAFDFFSTPEYLLEIKRRSARTEKEIDGLIQLITSARSLDEILKACNILYLAPYQFEDIDSLNLEFDYIFSQVVLEHVSPENLEKIFSKTKYWMKQTGAMVHTINFIDHFTNPGILSDQRISEFNFLKFSDEEWNYWTGNSIAYTNRLCHLFYFDLCKTYGLNVDFFEGNNYKERKEFDIRKIHPDVLKKYLQVDDKKELLKFQRGTFLISRTWK